MYAIVFLALIGQPQAPPVKIAQAPPVITTESFAAKARKDGKPFLVFVREPVRAVPGFEVHRDDAWHPRAGIAVYPVKDNPFFVQDASDADLQRWAGAKGVSLPASPFAETTAQRDGPRQALGSGAGKVLPVGIRWYDIDRKYQRLYTMNNGRFLGNDVVGLEDHSAAMAHSGGMEGLKGWASKKGLLIPDGKKVEAWKESTDVRAFALVPRWRWTFPEGTKAFDVLSYNGEVFEVRSAEKADGTWSHAVDFRDLTKAPPGYEGVGRACASCHVKPGQVMDVAGQIYRHVMWGDDGRFSWRPFDEDGRIVSGWPITVGGN